MVTMVHVCMGCYGYYGPCSHGLLWLLWSMCTWVAMVTSVHVYMGCYGYYGPCSHGLLWLLWSMCTWVAMVTMVHMYMINNAQVLMLTLITSYVPQPSLLTSVTGYYIQYNGECGQGEKKVHGKNMSSERIEGLQPHTNYTVCMKILCNGSTPDIHCSYTNFTTHSEGVCACVRGLVVCVTYICMVGILENYTGYEFKTNFCFVCWH